MENSLFKFPLGEGENPKGVLKGNSLEFDLQNKRIYKGIEKCLFLFLLLGLVFVSSCKKEVGIIS